MSARSFTVLLAAALAILVVAGPRDVVAADKSPFEGTYSGKFTFHSSNPRFPSGEGTVTEFKVTAEGKVSGKFRPPSGDGGDFSGTVDEDGELKYTVEFPTQTYIVKGLVVKTKKGSLKGNATQFVGRDQPAGTIEFELSPK